MTIVTQEYFFVFNDSPCIKEQVSASLALIPVFEEIRWRFTGLAGFKCYVTQAQYNAFSPLVRKWYVPYKCAVCSPSPEQQDMHVERVKELIRNRDDIWTHKDRLEDELSQAKSRIAELEKIAASMQPLKWIELLRKNKTATDEVIGAFLRGHAEYLTGETFVSAIGKCSHN